MTTVLWVIIVVQLVILVAICVNQNTLLQRANANADDWQRIAREAWEKTGQAEERRKAADSVIDEFKQRIAKL